MTDGDPLRTAFGKINDNFFHQTFTTTYKGSVPYVRDYVGLRNASGGGAPPIPPPSGATWLSSP